MKRRKMRFAIAHRAPTRAPRPQCRCPKTVKRMATAAALIRVVRLIRIRYAALSLLARLTTLFALARDFLATRQLDEPIGLPGRSCGAKDDEDDEKQAARAKPPVQPGSKEVAPKRTGEHYEGDGGQDPHLARQPDALLRHRCHRAASAFVPAPIALRPGSSPATDFRTWTGLS